MVCRIIVDRFVPAADLEGKRALYPAPKVPRAWTEVPRPGTYREDLKLNSAELEFWGGDLRSATSRLDRRQISPEYGTRQDFRRFAEAVHAAGMKLVLDGVFNHMGRNAPRFQEALRDPRSPWRDWFAIGPPSAGGARAWTGFQNLPELNLENPAVQRDLWGGRDSVVRTGLRDGADGWRLDTAFELGPRKLAALTAAAHAEKPGSVVIGEIANDPGAWLRVMDGGMGFSLRHLLLGAIGGPIEPGRAARLIDRRVRDAGIEGLLRSWVVIDNHDIPRLATQLPDVAQRRLAQILPFTGPGAPNADLAWMRRLIGLRTAHRALRVGDVRLVEADRLLAFERHTDRALETVLVFANPKAEPVTERVRVANAALMDDTLLFDLLGPAGAGPVTTVGSGFVTVTVPARTALALAPRERDLGGYSRCKGVR